MSIRGRWKLQKRSGSLRKVLSEADLHRVVPLPDASGASGSRGCRSRWRSPAPVSTTAYSDAARAAARSSGAWGIRASVLTCPPMRADGRAPGQLRPVGDPPGLRRDRRRQRPDLGRAHARDLHGVGRRGRPRLDARPRPRLGHRRVRDAPRARPASGSRATSPRAGPTAAPPRSSASSAARCAPWLTSRRSASARSGSTATSSRPTAAPAARRSAAPGSPSTRPSRG